MQLTIEHLESFQKMRHPIYFKGYRIDFGSDYNAKLYSGINFLFGSFFDNGWLAAYTLCKGKRTAPWRIEGDFYIDGRAASYSEVRKMSYYVGWDDCRLFRNIPLKTVIKLLGKEKEKADEIVRQLEIPSFLMDRPLSHMGHSKLRCSCMIGILRGKKILCYPWLEKGETDIQMYHFKLLSDYAEKNNFIVIVPSEDMSEFQKEVFRKEFPYNSISPEPRY